MTLRDLLDELEDIAADHGDHIDVRLAHQPRWPFEYSLTDIAAVETRDGDAVVYLGEGTQLGYLPQQAAVALGWAEAEQDEEVEQ
jgi:hypothetical protein